MAIDEKKLIDADALKEWFKDENGEGKWTYNVTIRMNIDAQPTIEAEPVRHGYNDNQNDHAVDEFKCSECGLHLEDWNRHVYDEYAEDEYIQEYAFKYCPECGAKMDKNHVEKHKKYQ